MTRFVVDTSAVLHLASEETEVPGAHKLLAPTLLRSQTLAALHEAVHRGEIPADVARERLDLTRHAQRVEQQQAFVVGDRVGGDVRVPRLARPPIRVTCLPVPETRSQLAHGAMLLKRCAFPTPWLRDVGGTCQ